MNVKDKYIIEMRNKKQSSLIALWVFGFGLVIWCFMIILTFIKEGFKFDWIAGLIILSGLWYSLGLEKYRDSKSELDKCRKDKLNEGANK